MTERDPSMAEVHQVEAEDIPKLAEVPVRIEGPVRAQTLPATSWSARSYELSATEAVRVARRDARRKRGVITVVTQAAWLGPSQSAAKSGVGYRMGAAATSIIEFTHTEEIWAIGDTAGSILSIFEEYWTE
jgi:hypothetical protein